MLEWERGDETLDEKGPSDAFDEKVPPTAL